MNIRGILTAAITTILLLVVIPVSALAATSTAKGYQTKDTTIISGMAVSLEDDSTSPPSVKLSASNDGSSFVGIVTTLDENLVTTSEKNSNIYVVTNGEVAAYVSDINGEVKKDDLLALSPLKGVLMRTDKNKTDAIAVALTDQNVAETTTKNVNNSGGGDTEVKLNKISVDLAPSAIENNKEADSFLVVLGRSVTGKSVSVWQVVLAFIIFFILMVVEGSIIYGAIYSSIAALGRNPLSKNIVHRELVQVVVIALFVMLIGLGAIYMVLWS